MGPRPVDLHIEGLKKLGASIELERGYIIAKARRLKGARISFKISSVGATGNILMASVLAKGTTRIENAAVEPEITNLAQLLVSMGATIGGIGTNVLEVEGVDALHPANAETIPDRIETGTMLVACAICGGKVKIEECNPQHVSAITARLEDAGTKVKTDATSIEIHAPKEIEPVDVATAIYPGFPTDMQAQWIALMAIAKGPPR